MQLSAQNSGKTIVAVAGCVGDRVIKQPNKMIRQGDKIITFGLIPAELDYEVGDRIDRYCQELGLILRPFINMCIVSPPLTITRDQIDEMVRILRAGIEKAMEDARKDGHFKG